jgi:hypothetical protein
MILRLEGVNAEDVGAAKRSLEAMALSWGQEIAEASAEATTAAGTSHDDHDKIVSRVSHSSIPSRAPIAHYAAFERIARSSTRLRVSLLAEGRIRANAMMCISRRLESERTP